MVEKDNIKHTTTVEVNMQSELALRAFCSALPDDRKLMGNDFSMDQALAKEADQKRYIHPDTRAMLTYRSSLVILANFVGSLPHGSEISLQADYAVVGTKGGFVCEVRLPACSPIQSMIGNTHSSKQGAKCSAAFKMCLALLRGNWLTPYLKPTFTKQLPAMRNARLAISSKKKDKYARRAKPELWSKLGTPTELFAAVLRLANPGAMDRPSRPLVLLTREPLPQVSRFPLFFDKAHTSEVECVMLTTPIVPSGERLEALTTFSLRVFLDVFSKTYKGTAADLPYFLAPSAEGHDFAFHSGTNASDIIDWAAVEYVDSVEQIPCTGDEADSFFENKFLTDRFDGSRKFFLSGVRRDFKPRDPVPDWVAPLTRKSWAQGYYPHDIMNYSINLWRNARARLTFREDQLVVGADLVSLRRNLLDHRLLDDDLSPGKCLLILEPMQISAVGLSCS